MVPPRRMRFHRLVSFQASDRCVVMFWMSSVNAANIVPGTASTNVWLMAFAPAGMIMGNANPTPGTSVL